MWCEFIVSVTVIGSPHSKRSNKSARQEHGLTQEYIFAAIRTGSSCSRQKHLQICKSLETGGIVRRAFYPEKGKFIVVDDQPERSIFLKQRAVVSCFISASSSKRKLV